MPQCGRCPDFRAFDHLKELLGQTMDGSLVDAGYPSPSKKRLNLQTLRYASQIIVNHEMTDTGKALYRDLFILYDDDNDDDPDEESDDDNDDGTQPSAHHHRDIFSCLTSLRRMRHTS